MMVGSLGSISPSLKSKFTRMVESAMRKMRLARSSLIGCGINWMAAAMSPATLCARRRVTVFQWLS